MPSLGRLVVVDDDEQIVNMLLQLFTRAGYQVITMMDSTKAFSKIKGINQDQVGLDVMMPQVDGLTICNDVKGDLFEYLASDLGGQKKAAQFRTPRALELGAD